MTQLFILTADADAESVMRVVVRREFSKIGCKIDRHERHDAGIVVDGPERIRSKVPKGTVEKVLLLWDHHGSGRDRSPSRETEQGLLQRLEQCTWKDRSAAIAIVPELEEWIWHDPSSICRYYGLKLPQLNSLIGGQPSDPKRALNAIHHKVKQSARLLPYDFQAIAESADLRLWRDSDSFNRMINILHDWFPTQNPSKGPPQ